VDAPVLSVCNLAQARVLSFSERLLSLERELLNLSEIDNTVV